MPTSSILPDDPSDFPSTPSMPTMRAGGDANALGRIDHYDLVRKLGGGGFGVVYLALDTASGVEVAMKTLHPLLKTNAEEMDVLREKFRLVSRLSHPNIASALVLHPVRDVNIWDETARAEMRLSPGDSVMVMRYAPGVTLSKWRRQFPDGVVPLDQALDIARQIASALDYAHGERIVHRDIKPGNIMVETLTTDGGEPPNPRLRIRILDFGLAAEIRSSMSRVSTEQGDTSGTRPYMAPEQWLGRKQDGRADQYALACVLYELLSGAPPFAGVFETGDPVIMMAAVKGETPDEIEDVPAHVNAALLRALAKAPKERFPSCAAFIEALASGTNSQIEPPTLPVTAAIDGADITGTNPHQDVAREVGIAHRMAELEQRLINAIGESRSFGDNGATVLLVDAQNKLSSIGRLVKDCRYSTVDECLAEVEKTLQSDRVLIPSLLAKAENDLSEFTQHDRSNKSYGVLLEELDRDMMAAREAVSAGMYEAARHCLDRFASTLGKTEERKKQKQKQDERKYIWRSILLFIPYFFWTIICFYGITEEFGETRHDDVKGWGAFTANVSMLLSFLIFRFHGNTSRFPRYIGFAAISLLAGVFWGGVVKESRISHFIFGSYVIWYSLSAIIICVKVKRSKARCVN